MGILARRCAEVWVPPAGLPATILDLVRDGLLRTEERPAAGSRPCTVVNLVVQNCAAATGHHQSPLHGLDEIQAFLLVLRQCPFGVVGALAHWRQLLGSFELLGAQPLGGCGLLVAFQGVTSTNADRSINGRALPRMSPRGAGARVPLVGRQVPRPFRHSHLVVVIPDWESLVGRVLRDAERRPEVRNVPEHRGHGIPVHRAIVEHPTQEREADHREDEEEQKGDHEESGQVRYRGKNRLHHDLQVLVPRDHTEWPQCAQDSQDLQLPTGAPDHGDDGDDHDDAVQPVPSVPEVRVLAPHQPQCHKLHDHLHYENDCEDHVGHTDHP
mmetsp:Transcript_148252/g.412899  ORF Transcript_148252/g.412899 Transcript_148252/m.412899 type:complete len:327 (-) Transcript_148252:1566-2546(-)